MSNKQLSSMHNLTPVLLLLLLLNACGARPEQDASRENTASTAATTAQTELIELSVAAAQVITPQSLRAVTAELSDDRYQGRAPASAGDRMAQDFLAATLQELGFQPGGDNGSYLQSFELIGLNARQPEQWSFQADGKSLVLQQHEQFIVSSGLQAESASVNNADLVFVGYGIQAPEYDWNDYKGMDLRGKVLLMLNNDPDWDPELFAGITRLWYGRWDYKYEQAARQGAAAAIIIHTQPSAGYPWQVVQTSWTGEQFELPTEGEPRLQARAWVTEAAARQLLELNGLDLDQLVQQARSRDFQPVALGLSTSLELPVELTHKSSANVIGVLTGSDPQLRSEAVILTAHHDHLGMAEPGEDPDADLIYNGALDNASGVAVVMGVARAFSELRLEPKRSVVVNFVGAEEQGLLGSLYYALHPTFPAGKIAANVNVDGAGIWGKAHDLTYIGYGKSDLDSVVDEVAALQDRVVKSDQFPDRGSFYRSDQFSFARIGVPSVYADSGTDIIGRPPGYGEEQVNIFTDLHYHQPSDEIDDTWDFSGAVEDAVFDLLVTWRIANKPELPAWKPGDEFEQLRLEAIKAANGE